MQQIKPCPICQANAQIYSDGYKHVDCIRCGTYYITKEAIDDHQRELADKFTTTKISGWINENNESKIDNSKLEWLCRNLSYPSVYEKGRKLLQWLNKETTSPGSTVTITVNDQNTGYQKLLAICWAYDENEIRYLINYLANSKYISFGYTNNILFNINISPEGFAYLENFNKNADSNLGFCAMWFDATMIPVWEKSIEPGIKQAGYDAKRIDKHPHNGPVVDEIISLIRQSKFVVADLTGNRGGVYYEAGFAKGFGIEVIFTCSTEIPITGLHFDVRHYNFLQWEPEKYEEFKNNLALRIGSTVGRGKNQ